MAPVIYPSSMPPVPIVSTSVYTHLFSASPSDPTLVGGYPGSSPTFIDAPTGTTLTRAQLKNLTLSFGFGIRNHPQTKTKANVGDTVLIYSQNSLHWPVILFGCVAAGLRCTLANSAYNARELTYQYNDSKAKLLLTTEAGLPVVKEMFKGLGLSEQEANSRIIVIGDCLAYAGGPAAPRKVSGYLYSDDLLGQGKLESEVRFDGERAHETLYLCYSSGTTGKPKGVETTHQNITSVVDIVKPMFPPGAEKLLGILPFYHIYGAVMLLQYPLSANLSVTIQPRFDPVQFCASIERYKIDIALIVPPVLVVLARHPAVDQYDISSLAFLFSGAAPLGAGLTKQVVDRLIPKRKGKGAIRILQGYGLTETSPTSHFMPLEDWSRKMGSCGILLSNLEARLVIDGDGEGLEDALPGQPGELWLRGPTIMKGYLNNPTATVDAITKDGWFKTGDIAKIDAEGFYYIVDRRKELIKYKGFQVPPAELESVLLTHPDVADCAVIGVESAREATELPRAYIVAAYPSKVKTPEQKKALELQVQKWITTKVAKHKFLRGGVVVIDIIPKSAAGKILRRELRDKAKEELAGRDPGDNIRSKL